MHRHGIVLAKPLLRSLVLAAAGGACFFAPWPPAAAAGAVLLVVAACLAVLAVARWDRTHVVVTDDGISVVHGLLRRSSASVAFEPGKAVEVERSLLGRILGYGTVVAGELEIDGVSHPERLFG
ncbi:MAG TPA: PH domain-containing protein [Gaiellaceae bacterium]|nr:PH domain-containing protein [Gaiellaceae bacterium]